MDNLNIQLGLAVGVEGGSLDRVPCLLVSKEL